MSVSPQWDPDAYLTFADERGRPFVDLLSRVRGDPATIVDLGCGPGQLTPVLRRRWPAARIVGVDSSAQMIARANAANRDPNVAYKLADVVGWDAGGEAGALVVSNSLFQWVPEQFEVIAELTRAADEIAIQVPNNFAAPSHALLRELATRAPYQQYLDGFEFRLGTGVTAYLDFFAGLGWHVDAWETTYQQILPGDDAVFAWMSGTGARPVLQALPAAVAAEFAHDYRLALRSAYPRRSWGTLLPFARVFVVARRPDRV